MSGANYFRLCRQMAKATWQPPKEVLLFPLTLSFCFPLTVSVFCVYVCMCMSWKSSPAPRVFDWLSPIKSHFIHGSSQAIKWLHTLKVVTSAYNKCMHRHIEQECFPGMCVFQQVEKTEWMMEKVEREMARKGFGINGYICLRLHSLL